MEKLIANNFYLIAIVFVGFAFFFTHKKKKKFEEMLTRIGFNDKQIYRHGVKVTASLVSSNKKKDTVLKAQFNNMFISKIEIVRKGIFSRIGFGRKIEIGDPEMDELFVVKGDDESRIRQLFADQKWRNQIKLIFSDLVRAESVRIDKAGVQWTVRGVENDEALIQKRLDQIALLASYVK